MSLLGRKSRLGTFGTAGLAGILALVLLIPAHSADVDITGRVTGEIGSLDDFDIIIGDLGSRYDGWSSRDTRVLAEVYDGRRYHDHYFDNLPAMMFVLREMYDHGRITRLEVPDYSSPGDRLIDGRYAWYVWDYDRYSRGGTPLVLAFDDYGDAREAAGWRNGDALSYEDTMWRLYDWTERANDHVYWRGWDRDRWDDPDRWERAWDQRWPSARWDSRDGWVGVELRLGDFTVRWESDSDVFRRDRYGDDHYYRNRVIRDFVFDGLNGGFRWVSGMGDHDRGHGNDPDGYDEDNPGKSKGHGAKSKPGKGPKNNPGKGKNK